MTASSHTQMALDRLYLEYSIDPAFAHLRAGGANFVPGDGSLEPRAIFIGEAPGVQEDRQRKPFVGASGALLNSLLSEVHLPRHECWITNVMKYRPPDNRTPTPEEVVAARPYLRAEVTLLGDARRAAGRRLPPVVLLGATALSLLGDDLRVSQVRGEILKRGEWRFLPVYHPAAALRNGNLRSRMEEDMRTLRTLMR
jgi:uracil-DNA glycosylase family 4